MSLTCGRGIQTHEDGTLTTCGNPADMVCLVEVREPPLDPDSPAKVMVLALCEDHLIPEGASDA